jgi:hypothetical protein
VAASRTKQFSYEFIAGRKMSQINRRQFIAGAGGAVLSGSLPLRALAATTPAAAAARTVIAAYYGGWGVPMEKSVQWVHGDNPWGLYPNAKFPSVKNSMQKFPERAPLIGAAPTATSPGGYDETQQSVIDSELKTASTYGVKVFGVNWYRDEFLNHTVTNLKASKNKGLMKWYLQWSNNSNNSSTNPPFDTREYFFEGIRRAAVHMKDSAYWTLNGKPVFAIYDPSQIDRIINLTQGRPVTRSYAGISEATLEHDAFLQDCHNIVANVLAGDVTGGISGKLNKAVVSNRGIVPTKVNTSGISGSFTPSMYLVIGSADVGNWARCNAVQGLFVYNIRQGSFPNAAGKMVTRFAHSFAELMVACQQSYDLYLPAIKAFAPNKTFWPTLMSGWDQRPWGGTTSDPAHDNCIPTQAEFEAHCKQVRAVLDKYPTVTNGTTFVYAWNELGEGGWIVPTPGLKDTRLVSIKNNLA